MKNYDVICAGLATVDIIAGLLDSEILKRDSTYLDLMELHIGGDAVNQAIILSRLGLRTPLMALVGEDYWGNCLCEELKKEKVDCSYLSVKSGVDTPVSLVLLDKKRERHFAVKKGAMDLFGIQHINFEAVRETKIVSLASNLALKSIDGEGTVELFSYAKKHGVLTVADYSIGRGDEKVNLNMLSNMLRQTDYALPSLAEASVITGETEPKKIVKAFRELGASRIILKLGEQGCLVYTENEELLIPAYPSKVVDTTGAGDCFAAGFLYGIAQGFSDVKSARLACAAGSIAVETVGANTAVRNAAQLYKRANMNSKQNRRDSNE